MRKIYYVSTFLFLSLISHAQDTLDSLWSVWSDETKADTIRLEAIYKFIQGGENNEFGTLPFFVQNNDSLLTIVELVHDLTETSGSKKYKLINVRLEGFCSQLARDFSEAVKLYTNALEMAREMQDQRLILI